MYKVTAVTAHSSVSTNATITTMITMEWLLATPGKRVGVCFDGSSVVVVESGVVVAARD